ncbi:hypothetical protein [Micromonospora sp. NPDC005652]|uniref:phage distal tail protein n=1 Tax=Micromonospora sp. NPDC005652 TaxID=3157046 RepID=UPI0033D87A46
MPLAVAVGTPPVVVPPTSPPIDPRPIYDPGTIRATWTDPDDIVYELTGPHDVHGWLTTQEISGWGATPISHVTDPLARGGVEMRTVRVEPRRITWPLNIYGETNVQWRDRYRRLMKAFTKTTTRRQPGTLTVWYADGQARSIQAWYEDGFGGEGGQNWLFANPVLTLFCPDGYWRDVVQTKVRRDYAATTGKPFLKPYLSVSSSRLLGDTTITNPGDVEGWPLWTIVGPASSVVATNRTTGQSFTLTHELDAGEVVTIDTTSSRPSVRGPEGQNLVGALDWPASELWPLVEGVNDVTFQMVGAAPGAYIELVYHPRYESV